MYLGMILFNQSLLFPIHLRKRLRFHSLTRVMIEIISIALREGERGEEKDKTSYECNWDRFQQLTSRVRVEPLYRKSWTRNFCLCWQTFADSMFLWLLSFKATFCVNLWKVIFLIGSGCGSMVIALAFETKSPQFKSNQRSTFI